MSAKAAKGIYTRCTVISKIKAETQQSLCTPRSPMVIMCYELLEGGVVGDVGGAVIPVAS